MVDVTHESDSGEAARRWWRAKAEGGHALVMVTWGQIQHRLGDTEAAHRWWTRAAEAGGLSAMRLLVRGWYQHGEVETSWRWQRAAEGADPAATTLWGYVLLHQGGQEAAAAWWEGAAEAGDLGSAVVWAELLRSRGETTAAKRWWGRAADAGSAQAMGNLANLLWDEGDREGAARWWRRAADAGNPVAMTNVALVLEIEHDDRDGARAWRLAAAEMGETEAMFWLGTQLSQEGDREAGRVWWERAAEAGDSRAQYNLMSAGERFARQTWRLAPVGSTIIGVAAAIHVLAVGVPVLGAWILAQGGHYPLLVANGEWHRLITSAFLHAQRGPMALLHILFNMGLVYLLARELEPKHGSAPFAALYLTSALGGSAASQLAGVGGIGASGAVFGLLGAAFVTTARRRRTPQERQNLKGWLWLFAFAASQPLWAPQVMGTGIGWEAHLGGLATGLVVASVWVLVERLPCPRTVRTLLAAAFGAVPLALTGVVSL